MSEFLAFVVLCIAPIVTWVAALSTTVFVCAISIPTLLGLFVVHRFGVEVNQYRDKNDGASWMTFILLMVTLSFFVYCRYSGPITASMIGWSALAYIGAGIVTMIIGWFIYLYQVRDNCNDVLTNYESDIRDVLDSWLKTMLNLHNFQDHEEFITNTLIDYAKRYASLNIDLSLDDDSIFNQQFMKEFYAFCKKEQMGFECTQRYDVTNTVHRFLMLSFQLKRANFSFVGSGALHNENSIYRSAKAAVVASKLKKILMMDVTLLEDIDDAASIGKSSYPAILPLVSFIKEKMTCDRVLKAVIPPKFSNLKSQMLDDFINWPIALLDGFFGKLIRRIALSIVDSFKSTYEYVSKYIFKDVI